MVTVVMSPSGHTLSLAGALPFLVLARRVLNWNVLDYPLGSLPGVNWILYGYGVPALAFWWAARRLRQQRDDSLVTLLEGGALVLFWLLLTLEIRSLFVGPLDRRVYDLPEQSPPPLAWLRHAHARPPPPPRRAPPAHPNRKTG